MPYALRTLFCLWLLLWIPFFPAVAGPIQTDLELGVEWLAGETRYQVGDRVATPSGLRDYHFPLSELEFPLDSYLVSMELSVTLRDRLLVTLNGKMNPAGTDPGTVEDSDWLTPGSTPDIYSTSDAELDTQIWSARIAYRFFPQKRYSFRAGLGYLYQDFEFEVGDTYQVSRVSGFPTGFFAGDTLFYDITYEIPYFELGARWKATERLSLELSLGYSPWAEARDEDQHLRTGQISYGECDGSAELGSAEIRYLFTDHWSASLRANYCRIDTEGRSTTYDTGGDWEYTIDQEIESEQTSARISLGYHF